MKRKDGSEPLESDPMESEEWASLCYPNCAACCRLVHGNYACPSLDTHTRLCKVYPERTKKEMCLQVTPENTEELHERGILPEWCGYVRHVRGLPRLSDDEIEEVTAITPVTDFRMAPPWLQQEYFRQRKVWLAKVEHDERKD